MVGRQKVKGFKAVHIQFQGLFVAGGGQQSVVHGIIDLTAQQANGAADLKYTRDGRKEEKKKKRQRRGSLDESHNMQTCIPHTQVLRLTPLHAAAAAAAEGLYLLQTKTHQHCIQYL